MTDVVERERLFYNLRGDRYRLWRAAIWRAIGAFNRSNELDTFYDPRGKRVLMYGCGPGNDVGRLVAAGATSVAGIDISEAEIEKAWTNAREGGYAEYVDFRAADAQDTDFPDDSFDLIVGNAIIHHLDVDRALVEIGRILAPGGRAVFLEPLAHNPLLRLGRRLTPAARTPDEHPLTVDDWRRCARVFPGFSHREVEFLSILLMPLNLLLPRRFQEPLARRVKALDDRMLERYPRIRPLARTTFLVLE